MDLFAKTNTATTGNSEFIEEEKSVQQCYAEKQGLEGYLKTMKIAQDHGQWK